MTNDIEATLNLNAVLNGYGYASQTAHNAQRQLDLEVSEFICIFVALSNHS